MRLHNPIHLDETDGRDCGERRKNARACYSAPLTNIERSRRKRMTIRLASGGFSCIDDRRHTIIAASRVVLRHGHLKLKSESCPSSFLDVTPSKCKLRVGMVARQNQRCVRACVRADQNRGSAKKHSMQPIQTFLPVTAVISLFSASLLFRRDKWCRS